MSVNALATRLPFDDPGITSNTTGLPGLGQLRTIVGAMLTFGLVVCVAVKPSASAGRTSTRPGRPCG